nr:hypothetical protein [Tanacetum cinerariifolium]
MPRGHTWLTRVHTWLTRGGPGPYPIQTRPRPDPDPAQVQALTAYQPPLTGGLVVVNGGPAAVNGGLPPATVVDRHRRPPITTDAATWRRLAVNDLYPMYCAGGGWTNWKMTRYHGTVAAAEKSVRGSEKFSTRRSYFPRANTIPRHSRRKNSSVVESKIRTSVTMVDRTMEELLQAPSKGYGEAIVIPEILAENFEIKTNLLKDVLNDAIKLMLFPYSLEDRARIWYEKEPPNSILTWEDLVNKFVNQFFPPSKSTHLKNEISRFTQRFDETFSKAWDRFKEFLRACPHHGFLELTQIDTFYNGLTEQDQDSLNAASGGNLLNKTTREALQIIENKSKVRYSRSRSNIARVNTNSRDVVSKTDDRIDKLVDQISNLVDIVNKQVVAPAKAVEKVCVTCGGAHAYYECIATDSNPSSICAATGSYNQVSSPNRASHQIPPPVQNNPNRFN